MRKTSKDDLEVIRYLSELRWGKDVACPSCSSGGISPLIEVRGLYQCRSCRKQFGIFNGTIFEGTRLSPFRLMEAVFLFHRDSVNNYHEYYVATKKVEELIPKVKDRNATKAIKEARITREKIQAMREKSCSDAEIAFKVFGHGEFIQRHHGAIGVRDLEKLIGNYSTAQRLHKKLKTAFYAAIPFELFMQTLMKKS